MDLYQQAIEDAMYTKECVVRWHYASVLFGGHWHARPLRLGLERLRSEEWIRVPALFQI